MPSNKLDYGNRYQMLSHELHARYKAHTGSTIDWKSFKDIIVQSGKIIAEIVSTEPEGFRLPENLGYLVVTRYNSVKKPMNYKSSQENETFVIHNNMHSSHQIHALRWYNNRMNKNVYTNFYKFKGCRSFTRNVSKNIKAEVPFLHWDSKDFFNYNKVTNLYKKLNRKHGSNKSKQ